MKNLFVRQYLGRAVLLFCLTASIALADVTATLKLTRAPNYYGGQYTSPYTFLVNGTWSTELACLDILRHVDWVQHTYRVYDNTGPDWPAVTPPPDHSTQKMYDAAAILTVKMLGSAGTPDSIQGQYAWAIWKIFQDSAVLPVADETVILGYITSAMYDAEHGLGIPTYTVYEPLLADGTRNLAGQRFIGVPDGGVTLMLLGGVLVGLETLRRRFRA